MAASTRGKPPSTSIRSRSVSRCACIETLATIPVGWSPRSRTKTTCSSGWKVTLMMRWRRSYRPSGWSSLPQERKKEGAGQYTIDMDISKLGTVYKHMASLLDLRLPHAPSIARRILDHLQFIGPGKHRDRRPTREEIVKIFKWFAEHPEREQAVPDVIRVAMKSAFWRGELFRLTWSDLDVERRLALVRDRKHPRQKKGNDEWVPLIGDSLEVLLRQARYPVPPAYEAKRKADPRIEPHPNEYTFRFDKSTASKYFKLACVEKGIVDLRLHDLRHEATSALFEDGWDISEVAAVTGHKDWRNLKRYT